MGHLATPKHDGCLDLASLLQKLQDVVSLDFEVVLGGPGAELDFLELDGLLVLLRLVLALVELVEVFAVVDDTADRRVGGRRDLHKVEALPARDFQSLEGGHNSQLLSFPVDHADFFGADPLIHANETISDSPSLPAPKGAIRFKT